MCFLSFTVGLAATRGWSPISLQFCHRSRRGPPHGGLLLPTCTAYGSSPSGSGTNELSTRPPRIHVQQLWGILSPRIHQVLTAWQYRLWSFYGRDTKLKRFLSKNQLYSNENYQILRVGVMASCQKLGIILENRVI